MEPLEQKITKVYAADCYLQIMAADKGRLHVGVFHDDERRSREERALEIELAPSDTDYAGSSYGTSEADDKPNIAKGKE